MRMRDWSLPAVLAGLALTLVPAPSPGQVATPPGLLTLISSVRPMACRRAR